MASDNFNRANETPLASPWTKNGGNNVNLVSNTVQLATAGDTYWKYTGGASTADQFSSASETSTIVDHDWGPAVRVGGAAHTTVAEGYAIDLFQWGAGSGIIKHVNGSFSQVSTFSGSGTALNDVIRIEAQGTTLRAYRNGVQLGSSATDASLTSGLPGMFFFANGGAVDNWSGGDLGGTAALSGTAAGVGAVTANLTAPALMSGTAAGTGAVAATLTASPRLSGAAAGVGSVTGNLKAPALMSGTAAGIGSVTAGLTARALMTGTAAGVGSITGNLTVPGNAALTGTAAGVGAVAATLTASSLMSATAAGTGSVTAALTASPRLSATAAGAGAVIGNLTASALLSATAAGVGAVTGNLTVPGVALLTGSAAGIGAVTANLTASTRINGTAAGAGSVTALLTASSRLIGTATGVGAATGTLSIVPLVVAVGVLEDGLSTSSVAEGGLAVLNTETTSGVLALNE